MLEIYIGYYYLRNYLLKSKIYNNKKVHMHMLHTVIYIKIHIWIVCIHRIVKQYIYIFLNCHSIKMLFRIMTKYILKTYDI